MPAMKKNFSAAKKTKDDELCRNPEAEEEEDLERIDQQDDDNDGGDEMVGGDMERDDEDEVEALEEDKEDSEKRSQSATSEEQPETEFVELDLGELRKDVTCPICLGIIRKTRTVMECLHRFCQECIDKSMRLGNNECPACRKHCASRRSLRADPRFDAFIAALFGDIDAFEAKESTFLEEEKARNKQIQESFAQISQRQSEALGKRKSSGKEAAVLPRPQRIGTRSRRNCRNVEQDTSEAQDDDDNENTNISKDSSSDEPCTERRERKRRKPSASRSTVSPSASNANNNNNNAGNDTEEEAHRGISPGLVLNLETLAWGRGGTRSAIRQNQRARNNDQGDSVRKARLNRLVEYFGSLEADSLDVAEEIAAH